MLLRPSRLGLLRPALLGLLRPAAEDRGGAALRRGRGRAGAPDWPRGASSGAAAGRPVGTNKSGVRSRGRRRARSRARRHFARSDSDRSRRSGREMLRASRRKNASEPLLCAAEIACGIDDRRPAPQSTVVRGQIPVNQVTRKDLTSCDSMSRYAACACSTVRSMSMRRGAASPSRPQTTSMRSTPSRNKTGVGTRTPAA